MQHNGFAFVQPDINTSSIRIPIYEEHGLKQSKYRLPRGANDTNH